MSIDLQINPKPNIEKEKFVCDVKLHSKLEKYPMVDEFLNKSNTTLFIGGQGSGKTSLLIQMLKKLYKKCFHHIYVFIPSYSRASLGNNIFGKLPTDQLYEELNEQNINEVYEKIKENSKNGEFSLIIMDDVQKSLKHKGVLLAMKNIVANMRHLRTVCWIILQNFFALDIRLRELVSSIILFKVKKSQIERIFKEYVDCHCDKFEDVMKLVYDRPHQWLFLNIATQKMFRGFDTIIFKENDEPPPP